MIHLLADLPRAPQSFHRMDHAQVRTFNLIETKNMRSLNPEDINTLVAVKGMVIRCGGRLRSHDNLMHLFSTIFLFSASVSCCFTCNICTINSHHPGNELRLLLLSALPANRDGRPPFPPSHAHIHSPQVRFATLVVSCIYFISYLHLSNELRCRSMTVSSMSLPYAPTEAAGLKEGWN